MTWDGGRPAGADTPGLAGHTNGITVPPHEGQTAELLPDVDGREGAAVAATIVTGVGPNNCWASHDDRCRFSHIGMTTKSATRRLAEPINSHWAETTELPKYVRANVGGIMPAIVANEKVRSEIVVKPAP